MIPLEWIEDAALRLEDLILETPISYDQKLELYLKWENQQITGSFKLRGALNKVLSLQPWEASAGLVTCSAGNHGQGVAYAARHIGTTVVVFASAHATPVKISAMRQLGAEIRLVEGGYSVAERLAQEFAQDSGRTFISPYNDGQVIAGQGTIGLEIAHQSALMEKIRTIIVPIGGGGLISGIGTVMAGLTTPPRLTGVQSTASPYFHQIFHHGHQNDVVEKESIADGLSGEVDHASVTIPMVTKMADEIILVSEDEIAQAIRYAKKEHDQVIEGSGAVGLAARLAGKIQALPAIAIITGGNIQPELLTKILENQDQKE